MKYARVSTSIPTVNIWCDQTINPNSPIDNIAYTIPMYPNIGFSLNVDITCDTTPKAGNISIYTSGCPKNQNRC